MRFYRGLNVATKAEHRVRCNADVNVGMLTKTIYREFLFSPDCAL
jgi:hypothetical protein